MNVTMPEAEVVKLCAKAAVVISAIETLPSGGTHLVCLTSEGAEEMRQRLKTRIIEGRVKRYAFVSLRASS